jgi:hypothetical protein
MWIPSPLQTDRFLAFGMPETALSSRREREKCRKHRQLDTVVSGMPKILDAYSVIEHLPLEEMIHAVTETNQGAADHG